MKIIYKYKLSLNSSIIKLPRGSKVLKFSNQGDDLFIWVLVDTDDTREVEVEYNIFGTGHEIRNVEGMKYFDSAFTDIFVWHLYIDENFS